MLLSIVSGTFNRLERLQNMMATARRNIPAGMDYEFVIIDGGSTDGTLDWLRTQRDVVLIEDGKLTGAISAFTRGAYAAQGKYVLMANDDITIGDGAILRAILYLEDNPTCGGVAFADDRPAPGKTGHKVMQISGRRQGRQVGVNYAQVGLFRKWLGDAVDWWGANTGMKEARTYGADAYLSARCWELGYSVDAVPGVEITENMVVDELRRLNGAGGKVDSEIFTSLFPNGALVAEKPLMDNPDERLVRVLYLPVYEPGHTLQHQTKHGLRDALAKRFLVYEWDYLAHRGPGFDNRFLQVLREFRPDILFLQAHGVDPITPSLLQQARLCLPNVVVINWNGDVWEHGLTKPEVLELLRYVDLQLVVRADVLSTYAAHHIPAAYWQIAPEPVDEPFSAAPAYDVVFLANGYSEERHKLAAKLRELAAKEGFTFGLYGSGWPEGWSEGETTYDFAFGRGVYANAKVAISDNQFNVEGYVSNRLFEALAGGGAVVLQQHVPMLEEYTGLVEGTHYVEWHTPGDLDELIPGWLSLTQPRLAMASDALHFVTHWHTFDVRVRELFGKDGLLKQHSRRAVHAPRQFRYKGTLATPFGVMGRQQHYVFNGGVLVVLPEDAPKLLAEGVWEEVG